MPLFLDPEDGFVIQLRTEGVYSLACQTLLWIFNILIFYQNLREGWEREGGTNTNLYVGDEHKCDGQTDTHAALYIYRYGLCDKSLRIKFLKFSKHSFCQLNVTNH